ncbi:MAG: ABC transporter ATP-binding protein [Rhizobiales bacterium]|nr:ABC transporter ATP-binding protein [Hyphomicrobiales bacterium]
MVDAYFTLRSISFRRSKQSPLFQGLNFEVLPNDQIGVIGGNGAGKTSLFHLMMGLLLPQAGDVFAFGQVCRNEKDFVPVRSQVGYLFQNSDDQLFCPTVEEDVSFGPLNLGMSHKEAREITSKTLNELGLSGFEKRITHHLSGGEKKLVALASILAMNPKVLLLDEPTNNLDDEAYKRLTDILKSLNISKVIISHDREFLSDLTEKTYRLEAGQLHLE